METKRFCVACNNHYETLTIVNSFDTLEEARIYADEAVSEYNDIDVDTRDYNHHVFWLDVFDTEIAGVEVVLDGGFIRVNTTDENEEFPIVYTTEEKYAHDIESLTFKGEYSYNELEQLKLTYSK